MNIAALKTELETLLINTTNMTAAEKQKMRDRCVLRFDAEWMKFLMSSGLPDNNTTRGKFLAHKTVGFAPNADNLTGFWSEIYTQGSHMENINAIPPPETFE